MIKIRGFPEAAKCTICGREFKETALFSRADTGYICTDCVSKKSYCSCNAKTLGKGKRSFSIEFETSVEDEGQLKLLKLGFIPTSDSSIGGTEWKSPVFYSKKIFRKTCEVLDEFRWAVGDSCGTHVHVGTSQKNLIQVFRRQIFTPLIDYMKENAAQTAEIWGRFFNPYAKFDLELGDRRAAFSTFSRYETIEFRLPRFRSKEQYYRIVCFCIDATDFIEKQLQKITSKYPSMPADEAIKKVDKMIGKRLVELYKKHIAAS